MTPGLDTLLIIRNTRRGGWKDGISSSFGICCGLYVQALISALGLSVILLQSAWMFGAIKLAGAAYLLWLGCSSIYRVWKTATVFKTVEENPVNSHFSAQQSMTEGLLSNILNPKTLVFYMAFLPQFVNAAEPLLPQMLALASIHFAIAMIWQSLLTILVTRSLHWLNNSKVQNALDSLTGSILIAMGAKLALER